MIPAQEQFTDQVLRRGAFDNAHDAEQTIDVVLNALGECLAPDEAQALAHVLPTPYHHLVQGHRRRAEITPEALYQRVASRENVPLSRAVEHTQVVLQAMTDLLPEADVQRLVEHLGPTMSNLFTPRVLPDDLPEHIHSRPIEPGHDHTLATGKPGSRHPLSTARPEQAHTHSVARSDNPHGDTKLSSTTGMTQEREHETLAEGRPPPKRPLSEGR